MHWFVDSRWNGDHGIGRFSREVLARLPEFRALPRVGSPSSPWDPLRLAVWLRKERAGYFFSPGYNGPGWMAGRWVVTVHDLNHLDVRENSSLFKRWYYNSVIIQNIRGAARVLTVSEFSRMRIIEWSGVSEDCVINVGNGVGSNYVPCGDVYDPGFPYLLYVGNRKAHKNIGRLVEAYLRSGVGSHVRLVLTGPYDRYIGRLFESQGGHGQCVCLGQVPEAMMPALYRGAIALVLPSLYEGFGLPIIEAMACGTPVVTSNCTAMVEVAAGAAVLVEPNKVDSIVAAIVRVIEDSALRQKLRYMGINLVQRYSWRATAEKVRAALDTVVVEDSV